MTTATTILRAAHSGRAPLTFNRDALTAEIVIATDRPGADGLQLVIRSDLGGIEMPRGPLPILRDHKRSTESQIGWVDQLRFERLGSGINGLVGVARFQPERAADLLDLIEAGAMYWSIAFSITDSHQDTRRGVEVVDAFRVLEVSAVPVPLDADAITRSIVSPEAMTTDNSTTTATTTASDVEVDEIKTRAELKRERDILRLAADAGLGSDWAEQQITSSRSLPDLSREAVRMMRERLESDGTGNPMPVIGHPARTFATPANQRDLGSVLAAKMGAKGADRGLAAVPMSLVLRDLLSNDRESRGLDLDRMPITRLVDRAFSTSDFKVALESTAARQLLEAYQDGQGGVLTLATSRDLPDFRAMQMLRVSQYGEISEKLQGGEYRTSTFSEENAATLQASEYGALQVLTRKAVANDDLGIFGQLVSEMGRAAARKERSELAARLLSGFTWTSKNSTTTTGGGAMDITNGVVSATLKLRRQTDVDGNAISFEPRVLLVAPEQEAVARQALGEYVPNNGDDVMPFRSLQIEVDHYLPTGVFYLADTAYPQLVIGRIGTGPIMAQEEDFRTGSRITRVQHDFGTAVMDQRSIVKVTISP